MKNSSTNRRSLFVNSWPFRWYNRRRKIRSADSHARINELCAKRLRGKRNAEDWTTSGGKRRKTEKRNKGPIKTNWFSSPRPFVHRSVPPSGSIGSTNFAVLPHTYSHTREYLSDIRICNLVKIYRRTPAWRVISVVCWVCVPTWRYVLLHDYW